ncbi:type IV secretory system conjugative DNA transfer family protein [Oscillospiraceae bacterium MB24-C1]|nr:type IV secretory system conjugative DNA transfer family protein [Oscillospiraceae bacterium MB24-C1]
MNRRKLTFHTLAVLFLLLVFWYVNRASELLRGAFEDGTSMALAIQNTGIEMLRNPFYLSINNIDLAVASASVLVLLITALQRRKVFRPGEEYGSARFGTMRDIQPFIDKDPDKNIILTETEMLSMSSRMKRTKNEDYNRNKNVLIIGGAGSGKTRYFVKPNLLQMHSSYVVTDPKGTLLRECGHAFEASGYRIKVLNLNETDGMRQSQGYNPFNYIRSEADILKLVDVLMANTNGEGQRPTGDPFWQAAEKLLYTALIGYIWSCGEPQDKNIGTLLDLLGASDAKEEDEEYKNPVDVLFMELEREFPDHFAVRQYRKYRKAAGKTAKSILISCGARLAPFDIKEVRDLMSEDELELEQLGDRKTVLFVITSDTNKTFNFIAAMMYSQMFNLLCDRALYKYGGSLPVHVRCILDEFANIGRIPNFEEIISVIRSREISACPILQSRAQLESVYEKKSDIIMDNCDTLLFLGSKSYKTLEEMTKMIGRQTIDQYNTSKSRGSQKSDSTNYQKLGRELMTIDELASMSRSECICHIGGIRPFKSKKYDLTQHPRYHLTSDADRNNAYTPLWLRPHVTISAEERFEVLHISNH